MSVTPIVSAAARSTACTSSTSCAAAGPTTSIAAATKNPSRLAMISSVLPDDPGLAYSSSGEITTTIMRPRGTRLDCVR